ncbi:MAG: hypothetical protein A2381_10905 [Bdellovibrionales bacterium RIFOXYB1_FULL_37_110]|nr:MAG: hypothetical protein A2181_07045 [Bdellovibrionales bacterium RIFOXYA1_FULL_38_20]OFZ51173.1 MAG: hypothetical protein A2417_17890 [Bdellovibrionales bacterium RIFOXYC1_FULL_37_79]OFZ61279.1 MAG: hypothetical protein A2381_10905 [Bdellovibrionales bacterium RIFOXYB1_FULL_37_110]OFZ62142.1 MAG: hypothetical protein A2577_14480 [Bdellovibrionales bacterium RIFOXYD1_FULL_36_51]
MKFSISKPVILIIFVSSTCLGSFFFLKNKQEDAFFKLHESLLAKNLSKALENDNQGWPEVMTSEDDEYKIVYTFNEELTKYIQKLIKEKAADYTIVTVIDNNSGNVLSAVGYERAGKRFLSHLPFTSTHPSASLIKIVTAAELLEKGKIDTESMFAVNGRGSTLYKYQLKDKINRWTKFLTFKHAFALSNNVVFGKAAVDYLSGNGISKMAKFFGFNTELFREVKMAKSVFNMPEDQYNLAEYASGLNRDTQISPIHGALLSTIVANKGVLKYPKVVEKIIDPKTGETIWTNPSRQVRAVSNETAVDLEYLMSYTARKGTARSVWDKMQHGLKESLIIGGKTGSITGGLPYGKRDWLTAFAIPGNKAGQGISICVMNINKEKWYIKSTYLVRKIIEFYYSKLSPIN